MATWDKKIASFSRGSEEVYSLVCLPCHRDGVTRPAHGYCTDCQEHLCHECFKHHRKPAPCRHHTLQDEDAMPSIQQLTNTPAHTGIHDNITTPCPRHKTEMLKFFCHDHDLLLCCICVAQEHTKPCNVDYVPDISDKMVNGPDYKLIMATMDTILKKCTTIKTECSTKTKTSNDSLKDALHDIQNYRKQIDKQLNEEQKKIEEKIRDLQHQKNQQLKSIDTTSNNIMKMVQVACDSMKQLNKSQQANKLFMEVKQAQKQLHDYEQSIKSLSTDNNMEEYKFIPNQAINDVLQQGNMIGDISTKHQTRADSSTQGHVHPSSADGTITPTCLGEIYVKTSEDKKRCLIRGMTVLPPDRLVLADWSNKSIKLVDVNSKSITSQLSLGTEDIDTPVDITSTTGTQVAVTIPCRHHIQFISVSDKLSKSHTIQTDGLCAGICCHQDKLIVTYLDPGKLEILDMRGRVITRVSTDSTRTDIFNMPRFVEANSSFIYVTDITVKEVIMLNWNGEITGKIEGNKTPTGPALLHDGSLLVCDCRGDKVCQVAGDGTNSRTVLQDVRNPLLVCVDDGGHKLYIGRYTKEDKTDNNILIYNI